MTRKRRSGITEADAVLGRVIRVLETDDAPLGRLGPDETPEDTERAVALLRQYHAALVDLLEHGPLRCPVAVLTERGRGALPPPLSPEDVSVVRAELLQVVRSAVRGKQAAAPSTAVSTDAARFTVRLVEGRAVIEAAADTRTLVVLQMLLLLQEVGLAAVHECAAPDCQRLFVRVYRREFCSVQCQKRINARKQREIAQQVKQRRLRRRRQRRRQQGG